MWSTSSTSGRRNDEDTSPSSKRQRTDKQLWNEKNMHDAIRACSNMEMGVEEAASIFNVPKTTLKIHLRNKKTLLLDEDYKVFVPPSIPLGLEEDLISVIQDLLIGEFIVTPIEIRKMGYELASEKYRLSNLPVEKNCLLGNFWYKNFTTKYPYLDTDKHLHQNCPKKKSDDFFNSLEVFIKRHKMDAFRIFAVDVIELKFRSTTNESVLNSFNKQLLLTQPKVICSFCPAGVYIPPMFIRGNELITSLDNFDLTLEGVWETERSENPVSLRPSSEDIATIKKQIKAHLNKKQFPMSEENEEELREKLHDQFNEFKNKMIKQTEYAHNKVSENVFYAWLQYFIQFIKPDAQQKVILLVNDKSCVKSWKILQCCKVYGIILLLMPPHSVHKIHPMDGFTIALNRNLSISTAAWISSQSDKNSSVPINSIFKETFEASSNFTIAKNGFLFSGIWPVNRTVFSSKELGGESMLLVHNENDNNQKVKSSFNIGQQNVIESPVKPELSASVNMSLLCRICTKEKTYMKSLFEPHGDFNIKKIMDLTGVKVSVGDGLPSQICQYCSVQLRDAHRIKTVAIESNSRFQRLKTYLQKGYFNDKTFLSEFQQETKTVSKQANRLITNSFNVNSICRVCMEEKSLMSSIYQSYNGNTETYRKLNEVTQLQVETQENLSNYICQSCRAEINSSYDFIQKIRCSNRKLHELRQSPHFHQDRPTS